MTPAEPGRPRAAIRPAVAGDFMIAVDKSSGPTSRRVVDRVARRLGRRDLGHAGTLDPAASGLLLVLAGRATRLVPWIHEWDKEYVATIRLGEATDSLDASGTVVARSPVPPDVAGRLEMAARSLEGAFHEPAPMLSAVKSGGVRLYELARRGLEVERPPRSRFVDAFRIDSVALPDVHARVTCSSGTYVRSLAVALGERVGVPAHLAALRRVRIGPVSLAAAIPDHDLESADPGDLLARSIPLAEILGDWPALEAALNEEREIGFGRMPAAWSSFEAGSDRYRILSSTGRLVALVARRSKEAGGLVFLRVFTGPGDLPKQETPSPPAVRGNS